MAREQHLGQGERLDTEEVNIGNKTMQQEVSLSIDMVTINGVVICQSSQIVCKTFFELFRQTLITRLALTKKI